MAAVLIKMDVTTIMFMADTIATAHKKQALQTLMGE